eukprot:comp22180_c1_seq1/m.32577 comp22180_c1_seq1/g.32577  ORF comp22180_c1_seq1/g.32577 comp22180_c1_seq1/m.32577 type:complete len:305 (+) comp22180_c1_seq1:452-1366(+)
MSLHINHTTQLVLLAYSPQACMPAYICCLFHMWLYQESMCTPCHLCLSPCVCMCVSKLTDDPHNAQGLCILPLPHPLNLLDPPCLLEPPHLGPQVSLKFDQGVLQPLQFLLFPPECLCLFDLLETTCIVHLEIYNVVQHVIHHILNGYIPVQRCVEHRDLWAQLVPCDEDLIQVVKGLSHVIKLLLDVPHMLLVLVDKLLVVHHLLKLYCPYLLESCFRVVKQGTNCVDLALQLMQSTPHIFNLCFGWPDLALDYVTCGRLQRGLEVLEVLLQCLFILHDVLLVVLELRPLELRGRDGCLQLGH